MKDDPVRDAARAHTNLNTFAYIVTLLEGGHLYGDAKANKAANEIIAICKREQARWLRGYDKAKAKAEERDD